MRVGSASRWANSTGSKSAIFAEHKDGSPAEPPTFSPAVPNWSPGHTTAIKENSLKGVRYFLRNFTATAVKEHLRSQIEDSGDSPKVTSKKIELVRFIREGSFDWAAHG